MYFGPADQIVHAFSRDADPLGLTGRDPVRDFSGELPDLALQLADPRLAGVARDHLAQRPVCELELLARQAILSQLPRNQIALCDLELFALRVAGEAHQVHPVHERPGDGLREVRRSDEQHLRQVERHPEVVVRERVVLRRVQHLEQRRRRIALERHAELVHLVEQEDRVLGAGLLHPLNDAARHGAHIGTPVTPDVGLVPSATERDADVGPPHGPGDGLRD